MIPIDPNGYWSIHTHSRYSILDGMGTVASMVARARELGYPALALNDHGSMAGVAELYIEAKKAGIKPLPGIEAYAAYGAKQRKTFHVGLVATSEVGYLNLVAINNQMMEDFYYKPILDLSKINTLNTEGIVLTTGCFFGLAYSAARAEESSALNVIAALASVFDVYIEAQTHAIFDEEHDDVDDQYTALSWAKTLGLPMVLAQDSHYSLPAQRTAHNNMKKLGSWSDDPDSAVFPGEHDHGYSMISTAIARASFEPEVFERGMQGLRKIAADACVTIPPLDHFDPVIITSPTDEEEIERIRHSPRIPASAQDAYQKRITDELEVINSFGFAGYMLLIKEITDYLRSQEITYSIRGSAVGSLTCYLLGISNLDPITWGLGFDRFLSRNRAKLPDIDIDVDSARRDEVVAHLRRTYVVTSICNYAEMGTWRSAAGEMKGSAVERWKTTQRKLHNSPVINDRVFELLTEMCADGNIIASRGTHASGMVVAPDSEAMRWMPLSVVGTNRSADRFLTALNMDSTEAMGYIKIDLLGVKVLTAMDSCLKAAGITLDDIPFDDDDVFAVISGGLTDGMFQLDGWTTRKGVMTMKPRTIEDIIAAMALFRPATKGSGATSRYLNAMWAFRRSGKNKAVDAKHHLDIAKVIAPTFGEILFQEQMIDILKALGFTPEQLGTALKAIKASNSKVAAARASVTELMADVRRLADKRGWSDKDVEWLSNGFEAYADYSFNKAHATAYGVLAYQSAWLNYHYPGQFWQGMINAHGGDATKVKEYTDHLTRRKFTKVPVDVNVSTDQIHVDINTRRIYPALTSIKGLGAKIAAEITAAAPFESMEDFTLRLHGTCVSGVNDLAAGVPADQCPGAVGLLAHAGALRALD